MNKYICTGTLTRDSELKYLPNGTALLTFDIAVNTKITKEKIETIFWKCKIFGKGGEALANYLLKGQKLLVEARAVENKWTKQDGTVQISKELIVDKIEFIGCKSSNGKANKSHNYGNNVANTPNQSSNNQANLDDITDEMIPF